MSARKQQLLKRHRRNKRIGLLVALLALLAVGLLVSPWLLPILLVALWVAHEAWFADHLFYSPGEDYRYRFAEGVESLAWRMAVCESTASCAKAIRWCLASACALAGWGVSSNPRYCWKVARRPMPRLSNVG